MEVKVDKLAQIIGQQQVEIILLREQVAALTRQHAEQCELPKRLNGRAQSVAVPPDKAPHCDA